MQRQQQGLPDESTNKGAMLFNMPNIQANAQAVAWVRSVMGLVGGICAGVLGLTGGRGLLCFVGFYVLVSLSMGFQFLRRRGRVKKGGVGPYKKWRVRATDVRGGEGTAVHFGGLRLRYHNTEVELPDGSAQAPSPF